MTSDTLCRIGAGDLLGQADHGVFRGGIGRAVRRADKPADRGHVDDAAATGLRHMSQRRATSEEGAAQVHVKHVVPERIGGFRAGREAVEDGGVIDESIKPPMPRDGIIHKCIDRGAFAHIGDVKLGASACRVHRSDGFGTLIRQHAANDHLCTAMRQMFDRGSANAGFAARDKNNLAVEIGHATLSFE
ncbi:hypothetical protein ABFB10_20755 [Ponticoccus litoralis]|uniref:Uncharacterized protein n=1 Tax=Ponticoccus litoralis TaxID=422297 RepID=A0AAW9SUM3_9RHOB